MFKSFLRARLSAVTALSILLGAALSPAPALADEPYEAVFRDPGSSYILVFAYPSAAWLDWSSPSRLSRTSVQSTVAKRVFSLPSTIGHAQIAWSCRDAEGRLLSSGASGQSGENNGQSLSALRGGWGMSMLEMVFTDGVLESPQDVGSRIRSGAKSNQFSWAGFKVTPEQCMQLVDFVGDYRKAGAYKNYGFPVDPLKLEGGGCTSYANAALEKSGAPIPFRRSWVRSYRIPETQLGHGAEVPAHAALVPASRVPERKLEVGLNEFLFGDKEWGKESDPGIMFQYFDPELFYESFLHLENAWRQPQGLPLRQAVRTEGLDRFQQKLKDETLSWMDDLRRHKAPMQLDSILGYTGMVIDVRNE